MTNPKEKIETESKKGLLTRIDDSIYKLHFKIADYYQTQTGENKDSLAKLSWIASSAVFFANATRYNSVVSGLIGILFGAKIFYGTTPKYQKGERDGAQDSGFPGFFLSSLGATFSVVGTTQIINGVRNNNLEGIFNGMNFLQSGAGFLLYQFGNYINRADINGEKIKC